MVLERISFCGICFSERAYFSERMNFTSSAFCSLESSFKIFSLFVGSLGLELCDGVKKYSGETFRYSQMYRNISKDGFLFPFSMRFM